MTKRLGAATVEFLNDPTERRLAYTGGHGAGEYSHVDGARDAVWVSEHDNLGVGGILNGHSWAQGVSERIPPAYSMTYDMRRACYPASWEMLCLFLSSLFSFRFCSFHVLYTISPVLVLHFGFSNVGEWNLRWERLRFGNCRLAMLGLYDTLVNKCLLHWAVLWNARRCCNFQYVLPSSLINSPLNSSPIVSFGGSSCSDTPHTSAPRQVHLAGIQSTDAPWNLHHPRLKSPL